MLPLVKVAGVVQLSFLRAYVPTASLSKVRAVLCEREMVEGERVACTVGAEGAAVLPSGSEKRRDAGVSKRLVLLTSAAYMPESAVMENEAFPEAMRFTVSDPTRR